MPALKKRPPAKPKNKPISDETPIAELPNLGPQSARWLSAVHIHTLGDLREMGPVSCQQLLIAAGFKPSLTMLYAMYACLHNKSWLAVSEQEKQALKQQLAIR